MAEEDYHKETALAVVEEQQKKALKTFNNYHLKVTYG